MNEGWEVGAEVGAEESGEERKEERIERKARSIGKEEVEVVNFKVMLETL